MASDDDPVVGEIEAALPALEPRVRRMEAESFFNGPNDARNIFLSIFAGAGGTDACDFAEMLYRMYTRWLERNGYDVSLMDLLSGEEAGVRRVVLYVEGNHPFGHLKSEIGVHRLVRISPYNASGKRQTSFAAVDAVPEMDEICVRIKDEDLEVTTMRAGGPGGQHVNKTESAVRIVHLPTGVTVECRSERSQHLNRRMAMKMLAAKLYRFEESKRKKEMAELYGEKGEITFGSQIRSYVLHPYKLVKDHRTGWETGNVDGVLDGAIDDFIEAFLRWPQRPY